MPPIHPRAPAGGVAPAASPLACDAPADAQSLASILVTDLLQQRPVRPPDYRAENRALSALAEVLANQPDQLFEQLVDAARRLCRAESAGVSLLEERDGQAVFRWHATSGAIGRLRDHLMPRYFSPCGVVIDRGTVQVMRSPVQCFPYLAGLGLPVHEVLLVPFHQQGKPIGTLWVVAHSPGREFDAEDARVATTLSQFASAAWHAHGAQAEIRRTRHKLQARESEQAQSRSELAETRAQAQLVQARFEAFFDQSPIYAGILATDGVVIEVGRTALEACGYALEEVAGKPFWQTGWWRRSTILQEQVQEGVLSAAKGETVNALLPYQFADGSEHVVELRLSPIYDEHQVVRFLIAIGIDVTEQMAAERELASARRRLDSALVAAELGIYEWDVVNDRLYGNENALRLFNLQTDDTGAAPLSAYLEAIHPEDRERTRERVLESVRRGTNFETEYRVRHPEGDRWINSRGRMARNSEGQVVSFFGVVLDVTERKRVEQEREAMAQELRRLSAIHETVLSSTNDFAYIFDRAGRFQYANRPLLKVWAKRLEQVVGKTCYELGYPTWHADMHMREIVQVIATRQPIRGEVPFTGASGISGIYDYIFTPVFGPDGEVDLIAGTTRDVTERRRAEDRGRFLVTLDDATRPLTDASEITQTYARLLGEHLDVHRCAYADVEADANTFNLTGNYNRGVPSIVGRYRFDQFGVECLRQMRAGGAYVVEDVSNDPRTEAVRSSYEATQIGAVICVPLHKMGHFVAAMAVHHATPRVWQPGEIELVQLVANRCWESIERTRVVRALAENEKQLRLAAETARLGVWELDLPTEELISSPQGKANYGRAADDSFTYRDFWHAVHPDDRERVRMAMQQVIATPANLDLEYRTVWPDSSTHWVLVRGHATYGADGKPSRLTGVSLDITERKMAERELARLHEEAVNASRAKDDFLAALSHELRTPLNPVLLLASEAANDPALPAATRESFAIVRKNVELEARLIDDLLDLTSIARGKMVVRKKRAQVEHLLREAVATMEPDFAEKQVALELQLGAPTAQVLGDWVRLLQVFLNLLRNALKFTPPNGKVTISTTQAADHVKIHVVDTGIGMTPAEMERAFEAFEQGDHAAVRGGQHFGGLGLGLAIARQLVELHHGTIVAESTGRGRGSVLTVELPLAGAEDESVEGPDDHRPLHLDGQRTGMRLLLVEDHEPTRSVLNKLLLRRGHAVTAAGSLAEARAAAERERFDLVISDIGLPDGDGTTLMSELRERYAVQGIALTGYGTEHDIARSQEAGFFTHLTKPIRVEALEAALTHARTNQ